MCTLFFHINVGSTMNLISGTHYLCEKRKYAFMILRKYTIIFCKLMIKFFYCGLSHFLYSTLYSINYNLFCIH